MKCTKDHIPPIYLVSCEGDVIVTSTQSGRSLVSDDGPVTYQMSTNILTGAINCQCVGFHCAIQAKCREQGITPHMANPDACCTHLRKNYDFLQERGYLPKAARNVAALLWPEQPDYPTDDDLDASDDLSDAAPEYPQLRDFEISKFSPTLGLDWNEQNKAGHELLGIIFRKRKAQEDAYGLVRTPEWHRLDDQWNAVGWIGDFPNDATRAVAAAAAREHAPHLLAALRVSDAQPMREAQGAQIDYVELFED